MTDYPFVDWDAFLRSFKWAQGEHLMTIGETGSGKSLLLSRLVDRRKYVVVFVTKAFDPTFSKAKWPGFTRMTEWHSAKAASHGKVLLWPRAGATISETVAIQQAVFRKALDEIFRERNWCVVVDEVQWCMDELKLGQELRTYQHQARSSGITVVSGMQRPSGVPVVTYGAATHAFVSRQTEGDDVKRLAALGGVDEKQLRSALPLVPKHHWLYLHKGSAATGPVMTKVNL